MSGAGSAGGKSRLVTRLIFHRKEKDGAAQLGGVNATCRQAKQVFILFYLFLFLVFAAILNSCL